LLCALGSECFSTLGDAASKKVRVIWKLSETGEVLDPETLRKNKDNVIGAGGCLTTEEEIFFLFLLCLLEAPERPNLDYIRQLELYYGKLVSSGFISTWFKKIFPFRGSFRKPNLIPLDKFKKRNILRFLKYKEKMDMLWDHTMWNFIDEKHIINHDALPKKRKSGSADGIHQLHPCHWRFQPVL
jgi:hypothetical protein